MRNPIFVYISGLIEHSLRCVQVICGVLGRAAEEGKQRRLHLAQDSSLRPQQRITFELASKLVAPGSESGNDLLDENVLRLMPTIQDMEELDAKIAEKRAMAKKRREKKAEETIARLEGTKVKAQVPPP